MAYIRANLFKIENLAFNRTLWNYWTTDAAATVDSAGYFADAITVGMMRAGDLVLRYTVDALPTSSTSAPAISTAGFHVVASNDGTTVDVTDALALTVTDTD